VHDPFDAGQAATAERPDRYENTLTASVDLCEFNAQHAVYDRKGTKDLRRSDAEDDRSSSEHKRISFLASKSEQFICGQSGNPIFSAMTRPRRGALLMPPCAAWSAE
jgi:hypothetical protein